MDNDGDLQLYLPWPPTINSYYGTMARGRQIIRYIKKSGKEFRKDVIDDLREQLPAGFNQIDYKMRVGIVFYPPDRRKRDLDNYKKALFDALTEADLWEDDSLIDQDYSYRGEVVKEGRVLIRVTAAYPLLPFSVGLDSDITGF